MTDDKLPQASIEFAKTLAQQIVLSLPEKLNIASLGVPSKLPFKAVSLRAILIHRINDLTSGALYALSNGSPVCAVLAMRAVIEVTSVLHVLRRLIEDAVRLETVDGVDERLMRMSFGTRTDITNMHATNVLTQIDLLDKKYKGLREWYDRLSEVAHPNYQGLLAAYETIDYSTYTVTFGITEQAREFGLHVAVPALCASLLITIDDYNALETSFRKFADLCHKHVI
ncbi:MAG: hypothetical protein WD688_20760 [Candidatus Binatia bacterium]